MAFEAFDFESLEAERRVSAAKSIRTIGVDELKKIGAELFPLAGDPWADLFFEFLGNNKNATFHYAETSDGVHVVYCRDRDKGLWFRPGGGRGPLSERNRAVMKQLVEKS
jgi:hypothetical protein